MNFQKEELRREAMNLAWQLRPKPMKKRLYSDIIREVTLDEIADIAGCTPPDLLADALYGYISGLERMHAEVLSPDARNFCEIAYRTAKRYMDALIAWRFKQELE